jgi:hypothetical protein
VKGIIEATEAAGRGRQTVAHRGRKNSDEALALSLASGKSTRDAAAEAGVSERTAHRRLSDPKFRAWVTSMRYRLIDDALARLAGGACEAADTLRGLLKSDSDGMKLRAAVAILERLTKVSLEEFDERLRDLEEQRRQETNRGQW